MAAAGLLVLGSGGGICGGLWCMTDICTQGGLHHHEETRVHTGEMLCCVLWGCSGSVDSLFFLNPNRKCGNAGSLLKESAFTRETSCDL